MPRERAKERAFERAVKRTLAYRATFKYPLSFYQLLHFLITKRTFTSEFTKKELRRLTKNKTVEVNKNRYSLPGSKIVSADLRYKNSKELISETKKIFDYLAVLPWIKLIAITGSAAAYNVERTSDIDIFIITTKNRLWITRFFVVLILKITGTYPRQNTGKTVLCPNLLMDETSLTWQRKKQTVYTAHGIVMMQPIIDRDNMYFRFMKANNWALRYFGNITINFPDRFHLIHNPHSKLVDILEKVLMKIQVNYMKKKKTNEITEGHLIHFNKNDNSIEILNQYEKNISKLLPSN